MTSQQWSQAGIKEGDGLSKERGAGGRLHNCALTRRDVRTCSGFPCPQGLQVILPQLTNETVVSAARKRSHLVHESGQVLALSPSTRIA